MLVYQRVKEYRSPSPPLRIHRSHGAPGLAGGARALDRGEPLAPEPLAAAGDGDLATFL